MRRHVCVQPDSIQRDSWMIDTFQTVYDGSALDGDTPQHLMNLWVRVHVSHRHGHVECHAIARLPLARDVDVGILQQIGNW